TPGNRRPLLGERAGSGYPNHSQYIPRLRPHLRLTPRLLLSPTGQHHQRVVALGKRRPRHSGRSPRSGDLEPPPAPLLAGVQGTDRAQQLSGVVDLPQVKRSRTPFATTKELDCSLRLERIPERHLDEKAGHGRIDYSRWVQRL